MFSRLWQKALKLLSLHFEEFDGTQESFPCWATCNGIPIDYTIKLSNGKLTKATCLGTQLRQWRDNKTHELYQPKEVVAWRPPPWKKIGR